MNDINAIAESVDRAIIRSRLNALSVMMMTDRADRLTRIATSLGKLISGAYLVGTGPSTVGIIPLTVDEVILGRSATPVEAPADLVIDYEVTDTMYLWPHEVSRVHAKVIRKVGSSGPEFAVCDVGSQCGTFVNGEKVGGQTDSGETPLSHNDLISLGPSHSSTYLFILIE